MYMASDGKYLTGLWFEGSRTSRKHKGNLEEKDLPIFSETKKWLDIYFSGKDPGFTPEYKLENLTDFRRMVVEEMNSIPYGHTVTYNDIARKIAEKKGLKKNVSSGCGRSRRVEPYSHNNPVPPGGRLQWQPHGLWRWDTE